MTALGNMLSARSTMFSRLMSKWKGSFHVRLVVGLSGAIFLIMCIGSGLMLYAHERAIRQSAEARGLAVSRAFATLGASAVLENLFVIQEALDRYLDDPDILEVDIIDSDNMVVASKYPLRIGTVLSDRSWLVMREKTEETLTYTQRPDGTPTLVIVECLQDTEEPAVWIRIVFSLAKMEREAWLAIERMAGLTLLLMLAGGGAVWLAARRASSIILRIDNRLKASLDSLRGGQQSPPATPATSLSAGWAEFEELTADVTETTGLLTEQSRALKELTMSLEKKVEERTAELKIARDQALEATRLKSQFLANVSHEVRTPLNGLIGMTSLLQTMELTPEQQEYVEAMRCSGEALVAIINDILDFSKIEAGKLQLMVTDLNVRTVVNDVVSILDEHALRKGLRISCTVDSEVPRALRGDPGRLQQVLVNLVGNAVKFTEGGGVAITVTMDEQQPEFVMLRFEVLDTGSGISPESQERLFQPFSQVDQSSTRKYGGTGLGLAISKQLVELMGGQIGVESRAGRGSTFWFTVKLGKRQFDVHEGHSAQSEMKSAKAARSPKILVVDDNSVNQKVAVGMLQRLGYSADVAASGLEAVEAASRTRYDLILMDCQMPDKDGFDAAVEIRKLRQGPQRVKGPVPIVAMTAYAMEGDRERCLEAGMDDYIAKPVRIEDLQAVLGRWLRRRGKSSAKLTAKAAPSQPVSQDSGPVDASVLKTLRDIGGEEEPGFLNGLIERFLLEAVPLMAALRAAVERGDQQALERTAHGLKGRCGQMGAHRLAALSEQLQECGRSGNLRPAGDLLARLEVEFDPVRTALINEREKVS